MRIAYVHILPIEYYPPARNTLKLFSKQNGWDVRCWSSPNHRRLPEWSDKSVHVVRHTYENPHKAAHRRLAAYLSWHFAVARELTNWKPDLIISVEPHSAIAVWLYFKIFGGTARLCIHHHEYYAPEDFSNRGMRLVRIGSRLELRDLFPRAEWISQTNVHRLQMIAHDAHLDSHVLRVLPNYPPREWTERAVRNDGRARDRPRKFIYLGSASLEDAFILEAAKWASRHREEVSLSVVGNNIAPDVWAEILKIGASNISLNKDGWDYEALPGKLNQFDVGLILYKGNTKNFVYNVPNKAFEYLAAGLEVWYPRQMKALKSMHSEFPGLPMMEFDFDNMPGMVPESRGAVPADVIRDFTSEEALRPLIEQISRTPNAT